jgi:anthranilate phosphoribosyltransferase
MFTPEAESRIATLRQLGQQRKLTREETKEVLQLIRQDRVSAAHVSAASKAKKSTVSGADVLSKLQAALALLPAKK